MIVFDKLWQTMEQRGISEQDLHEKYGVETYIIKGLKMNNTEIIDSTIIDALCKILNCSVDLIMEYKKEPSV